MELYIGICDDDQCMLNILNSECQEVLKDSYSPVIHTAQSAKELLSSNIPYHIAVLDVQMEETDGVELARELMTRNSSCQILFISGFSRSVSYVYEVPHAGLVMKDHLNEYLPGFLKKAADFAASAAGETLTVQVGKNTVQTKLSDISFLERNGHWTTLMLCSGSTLRTREKLTDLIRRINNTGFCQCHVSYAVNLMNVRRLEGQTLVMDRELKIPISRNYQKDFMSAFYSYLSQSQSS